MTRLQRRSPSPTAWVGLLALAWFVLVLAAPLVSLTASAWPLAWTGPELDALIRASARGLVLSLVAAIAATLVATIWARTIPPLVLLAAVLIGRFVIAHGMLALGLAPGATAAVLTLIAHTAPFAGLIVALRMRARPTALLEAAADLGAGPLTRAWRITGPHLRPALLAAFAWTLLQALGDVIAFELAGGGRAYTLGLLIRDALIREDAPARGLLGVVALVALASVCAVAIAGELGHARLDRLRPLGPAPTWLRALGWASLLAAVAGPARLLTGPHPDRFGPVDEAMVELLGQSLAIAGVVATLAAVVGFGLAVATRGADPIRAAATVLIVTPLAIPPSVLGLLGLAAATRIGWPPGIGLTIATLLGPAVALAFVTARVLITAIPPALIDAAADLGARGPDRVREVWLPLGRPALLVAAAVVFAWVLGQAAIPAFTSGPGGDTLAVALTIHARAGAMAIVRRWSAILTLTALAVAAAIALVVRWRARP
jgi:ABC-type spermidine/putrescine transport system permease subunit II